VPCTMVRLRGAGKTLRVSENLRVCA
jgi:hypothetical protein